MQCGGQRRGIRCGQQESRLLEFRAGRIQRRRIGCCDTRGVPGLQRDDATLDLILKCGKSIRDGAVAEPGRVVQGLGFDGVLSCVMCIVGSQ